MFRIFLLLALFSATLSHAQNGYIKGQIKNAITNEPVLFANIVAEGQSKGSTSDTAGFFSIGPLEPGFVTLAISALGYETFRYRDIQVTNAGSAYVDIKLEPANQSLSEVVIKASPFNQTYESPISNRTIGLAEIERNPGGNRDISNVLKSFPGVASTPAFRNDIIIRGGSPSENRFYLDGVEVPVINHFQTQGASGGPTGIINVNLIRNVDFLSGAFPAARGNALSSVLEFNQVDGNRDKWKYRFALGSSDAAFKADGPIGKNSSFIGSARVSYLQFLFKALKLPFLPTYYDYQFKYKWNINPKNEISIISLGAIDRMKLNLSENETEKQRYLLNTIPVNNQWNYTLGLVYKRYAKNGTHSFVLSRNMFDNRVVKYKDNDESNPDNLNTDYHSQESENKFRYEYLYRKGSWKIVSGAGVEYSRYYNRSYIKFATPAGPDTLNAISTLHLWQGSVFTQASRTFFKERWVLSLGLRFDNNNFNAHMANPLNQFSPRLSSSVRITEWMSFNAHVGRYFQRPSYTLMGYRNNQDELANKSLKYIRADHFIAGFDFTPTSTTKITLEGFYKAYAQYPFSLRDSISLANQGAGFSVVGNEPADSRGKGRAYGLEFMIQQKIWKGFYGILSYTYVVSEFQDKNNAFIPSNWDNRHLLTLTSGYKFKRNWEVGLRWRYVGGAPFTPIDTNLSLQTTVYDIYQRGISDNDKINAERGRAFHQLDLRVDKSWFFKKWSLNIYVDVQNVYNFKYKAQDYLTIERDANGAAVKDPSNPQMYKSKFIENLTGTVLPSIGVIVDF